MKHWNLVYFSDDELQKVSSSPAHFNKTSLARLDALRQEVGEPLILTSGYRSHLTEQQAGRSGSSAHCLGRAFDIKCTTPRLRFKIVSAALRVGFNRIGIAKNYVHVDDSDIHSPNVIWHYYDNV